MCLSRYLDDKKKHQKSNDQNNRLNNRRRIQRQIDQALNMCICLDIFYSRLNRSCPVHPQYLAQRMAELANGPPQFRIQGNRIIYIGQRMFVPPEPFIPPNLLNMQAIEDERNNNAGGSTRERFLRATRRIDEPDQ